MLDMAAAREAFEGSDDFTVGIEEEFQILAPTGDDLDLRGDQLAGDVVGQRRLGAVAQLLEARDHVEG
ncbi:MAG TPA: hypothetical protein VK506_01345, partial [Conexibacter sp.]|nr:hypothetical protein [Conexibacter sp.]